MVEYKYSTESIVVLIDRIVKDHSEYLPDNPMDLPDFNPVVYRSAAEVRFNEKKQYFSYRFCVMYRGKTRSGKTYAYWHTVESWQIKKTKLNYFLARHFNKRTLVSCQYIFGQGDAPYLPSALKKNELFQQWLGEKSFESFSPLINHFNIKKSLSGFYQNSRQVRRPMEFLIPFMPALIGSQTIPEFTKKIFGVTRYRKDLARAVAECENFQAIIVAHTVRGTMPIDWIIQFLQNNKNTSYSFAYSKMALTVLREMMKHARPHMQKEILKSLDNVHKQYMLVDIMRTQRAFKSLNIDCPDHLYEDKSISNIEDFHDALVQDFRVKSQLKQEKELDVIKKMSSFENDLNEFVVDDSKIVVAQTQRDLIEWGQTMHNCIGSYATNFLHSTDVLGAVVAENKVVANFQISNSKNPRLVQLLGKYNQVLPGKLHESLIITFKDKGVQVEEYWGQEREPAIY